MSNSEWRFVKFGLIVTGDTEAQHLPRLFDSMTKLGNCYFEVVRQIGQRSPITSNRRKLKMVGSGQTIVNKDETDIGLPVRQYLSKGLDRYVLLVDDLERDRREQTAEVFNRYRLALDTMLSQQQKHQASVHFLVNMLEAYYFADPETVNSILGTSLQAYDGDVEDIPNPKSNLKLLYSGFDEVTHGGQILTRLNTEQVLSNPDNCASLRTLFAWCLQCMHQPRTEQYQLLAGKFSSVTQEQLNDAGRDT
jgi:Domain of unknown function (DUF4276)